MIDPRSLVEARLQLHYAVQYLASVASALIPAVPDYSHSALAWTTLEGTEQAGKGYFVSGVVPAPRPYMVALDPVTLTLTLMGGEDPPCWELGGQTWQAGLDWLKPLLASRGSDPSGVEFLAYPDDFPQHGIAAGVPFRSDLQGERQALADYFTLSQSQLEGIRSTHAGASPLRIWPHHFDMATLITLPGQDLGTGSEEAKSIGVGLSPGDGGYAEPYWYVTPWPYPPVDLLPQLAGGGSWHTQGWVGALLLASQLTSADPDQQLQEFLRSAVQASQSLLET